MSHMRPLEITQSDQHLLAHKSLKMHDFQKVSVDELQSVGLCPQVATEDEVSWSLARPRGMAHNS